MRLKFLALTNDHRIFDSGSVGITRPEKLEMDLMTYYTVIVCGESKSRVASCMPYGSNCSTSE